MGGLCLHCDLCGGEFSSKAEWNEHLVEDEHQNVVRTKWKNFLNDEFDKNTSSLVVTSFVINKRTGLDVVSKFSQKILDYVVNFVWWEEQPFLAVLQFESRKKLKEVLTRLENGTDATVNGNLVQLQKASEILQLTWRLLLPGERNETISQVPRPYKSDHRLSEIHTSSKLVIHPSSIIPSPKTSLQKDWNSICNSIEVPETECSTVLQIISDLTDLYQRYSHSDCLVILFRNFFLRLQSATEVNNVVLLFVYLPPSPSDSACNLRPVDAATKDNVFLSPEFAQLFPGYNKTHYTPYNSIKSTRFRHDSSGFMFNIISNPWRALEGYLARLALYVALFDSRVKAVLTLVTFWARAHKIRIAEGEAYERQHYAHLSDPFPLDWLVILFLIKEKVVPSVREVTDRTHPPVMISNERGKGHDIGFCTDLEFVQAWTRDRRVPEPDTDEFITSVVTLTRGIFKFYSSQLKEGCWLVNPKDGELIKREGGRCRKNSLSIKEIESLTALEESRARERAKIMSSTICVLNPLVVTWRLSFCVERWKNSTCHQMEAVAKRLTTFLEEGGFSLQEALAGGVHTPDELPHNLQCEKNQRLDTAIVTKRVRRRGTSVETGTWDNKRRKSSENN